MIRVQWAENRQPWNKEIWILHPMNEMSKDTTSPHVNISPWCVFQPMLGILNEACPLAKPFVAEAWPQFNGVSLLKEWQGVNYCHILHIAVCESSDLVHVIMLLLNWSYVWGCDTELMRESVRQVYRQPEDRIKETPLVFRCILIFLFL